MVTDGGSAFCKAFKKYGVGVDSLVERPENSNRNIEINNDDSDVNSVPFMQYEDGEQFYSNVINFNEEVDDELDNSIDIELPEGTDISQDDEFDDFEEETISNEIPIASEIENSWRAPQPLPPQRRCQSHLLHLTGGDFEEALNGRAKTVLVRTLNKLQALWIFPRKSSQAKTYSQEVLGVSLLIPCPTR